MKNKGKPGPEVHVAVAGCTSRPTKRPKPNSSTWRRPRNANYVPAILGYAQLKDQLGRPEEAMRLYERAVESAPKQAAVYNNIGMHHARLRRWDDAAAAIGRAIQREPKIRSIATTWPWS